MVCKECGKEPKISDATTTFARKIGMIESTNEVLERLNILWKKLDDEGLYVRANTVALAIEEINRLTTEANSHDRN